MNAINILAVEMTKYKLDETIRKLMELDATFIEDKTNSVDIRS